MIIFLFYMCSACLVLSTALWLLEHCKPFEKLIDSILKEN